MLSKVLVSCFDQYFLMKSQEPAVILPFLIACL